MTIAPFGWVNGSAPYLSAANLEAFLQQAGAYTDNIAMTGASRSITAATTIVAADSIITADATSAAFTQPLPASFSGVLTIDAITTGTNLVTLTPNGSDTIEGASTLTLGTQASGAPYQSVQLARVGTTWRII